MKKALTSLLGAAALCLLGSASTQAQTYQQVWADEFINGIGPDWQFETGAGGWGNNEKQYYQRANATVVNGELHITAKRENVGGALYTSARMKTQGLKEFTYGKMEARIKMPMGQGLWPAFWMLGSNINSVSWPRCGEIDIMEHINTESKVLGTVHWDSNGNYAQYGGNTTTTPADFHLYSIEWTPSFIKWSVDNVPFHEINIANGAGGTDEFQRPFFLLLNMAVGGNLPGQTVDDSKFPATMVVDYVRVYQLTNAPAPSTATLIQAEAFSTMRGVQLENTTDTGLGQNVGYIDAGDWMAYSNINFPTSGSYNIEYRVASPNGGTLSSDLNGGSIQLGNVAIPATGGWQTWRTITQTVNVNAGTYNFGIYAQTGGWNLNWIRISKAGTSATAVASAATAAPTTAGDNLTSLAVYPNPYLAGAALTIQLPPTSSLAPSQVQILDVNGRQIWQTTTFGSEVKVDQGVALKSGMYLIQVTNAKTKSVKKLVVQ